MFSLSAICVACLLGLVFANMSIDPHSVIDTDSPVSMSSPSTMEEQLDVFDAYYRDDDIPEEDKDLNNMILFSESIQDILNLNHPSDIRESLYSEPFFQEENEDLGINVLSEKDVQLLSYSDDVVSVRTLQELASYNPISSHHLRGAGDSNPAKGSEILITVDIDSTYFNVLIVLFLILVFSGIASLLILLYFVIQKAFGASPEKVVNSCPIMV